MIDFMKVDYLRVFILLQLVLSEFHQNLLLYILPQIILHFWKLQHVEVDAEQRLVKFLVLLLAEVILYIDKIGMEQISWIEHLFVLYFRKVP
jgi:hypothetical protein